MDGSHRSKERSLLCSLVVEHENKDDFVLLCSPGFPESTKENESSL